MSVLIFASGAVFALLLPRQWQWQWQWQWRGDWRLPGGRRKTLVVFGDSLTQHGYRLDTAGWVAGLSDVLVRRVDVLNRGYSGFTTLQGVRILPAILGHHSLRPVDVLFIFFGANDACISGTEQHVPLPQFRQNIRELVAVAKRHSLRVALITPPPIELEALKKRNAERGKAILADRNNEETRQYAQAVILEGASLKVPVLDIFSPMLATDRGPGALLLDGLHFNGLGNQQLLALVRDGLLKTHFPDLLAGELDFQNTF